MPVEIVYFRPPGGVGRDVVRLSEALGLFEEPSAGLEPELTHIEGAIEEVAIDPQASLTDARLDSLVTVAGAARTRIREAAYQQLHRDPYRADMAAGLLARVPAELDALNERVLITLCTRLGFTVERTRGRRGYAIELGSQALVDSLPGVPGGSTFVGSFDREEAVEDETIDFFASGHALVEGTFAWVEDSSFGRVARLEVAIGAERGIGLVAIYKDGPGFDVVACDSTERARPDWAAAFRQQPLRTRRVAGVPVPDSDWTAMIRQLGARLEPARRPYALAAIVVRPVP
jgi:ATP-dependent helicase HepA